MYDIIRNHITTYILSPRTDWEVGGQEDHVLDHNEFAYRRLALHWKLLVSGFILILCTGYLAAVSNAALSVGMSVEAIAEHYGDHRLDAAEKQAIASQGFVEEEFSLDDEPANDTAMEGATGMAGAAMAPMAGMHADDTLPPQILAQVSHIHLLAFSLIFFILGGLACLTSWSPTAKALLLCILFLGLWGDIVSINLVRFVSDSFASLTFAAGVTVGLCFAIVSLRVLWELWLAKADTAAPSL